MIKDIKKYLKNESNFYDNQEILDCREMFRGIVVKKWVIQSEEEILFDECNKILVKMFVKFYHDCLYNRRNIMHELENRKIIM